MKPLRLISFLPGVCLFLNLGLFVYAWGSRTGTDPSFQLGVSLAMMMTFGLVWTFGVRYPDVGWMVVIYTIQSIYSFGAGIQPDLQSAYIVNGAGQFALMLSYCFFLLNFFRAPVPRGALEGVFVGSILAFGVIVILLPAGMQAQMALGGVFQNYLGAFLFLASAVYGLVASGDMPEKRRRFVLVVSGLSVISAIAYALAARLYSVDASIRTPFLNFVIASAFAMLLLADLVIFHRRRRLKGHTVQAAATSARGHIGEVMKAVLSGGDTQGQFAGFQYDIVAMEFRGGRDWHYVSRAGDLERRIYFGHITGTGPVVELAAAAVMALLHEVRGERVPLPELAGHINRRLLTLFEGQIMTSFNAVSLAPDSTVDLLACGGTGYVVFSREGVRHIPPASFGLGVSANSETDAIALPLEGGDTLMAASPGLIPDMASMRRFVDHCDEDETTPNRTVPWIQNVLSQSGQAGPADKTLILIRRTMERIAVA